MFQLFKKRTFSSYINDTFSFFKMEGKNYIKNYFIINGGFLVLIMLCFYFVFQFFVEILRNQNLGIESSFLIEYIEGHVLMFSLIAIVLFVLLVLFSCISYAYPSLYLKNMEKNPGKTITTEMIVSDLKKQFGRIILYILGTTFIIFPLILITFAISVALIFVIIGIPILIILFPAIMSLMMISFNEFIIKETSFFNSFGVAFKMVKSNFWPIVGSTVTMYILVQIITTIFTAIPQFIMMVNMFTSAKDNSDYTESYQFFILYMVIMLIALVVSFILNNLMLVNQGLIYYSEREVMENNQSRFDIEQLGQSNE